ncbi:Glycosyl transferases group 1 [Stieleria neptunia]|uniref:tRNA-queuosine alpha-mannosyltransferase n=1 Tax=Stieleria neptunia TaxID=2527979 RepID=A0A518I0D5_9BACT|nr:DUF3524 domain-containing protein [Stieleria neptunia]QDV46573.1 Glycosyl transferases group 1 [Stieleria neptunia]
MLRHVLAIEPYYGGSHQAFLDGVIAASRHRWSLATLPARHWKWRMRSAPVQLSRLVADLVPARGVPDVVLASDMLDLPTWLGLASRDDRFSWLGDVPVVTYFHENQWAYPAAPDARADHHFGYTNLLTAAASDACWFNSEFNRRTFFDLSRDFVSRMPDARQAIDLDGIEQVSRVIAPGFRPPKTRDAAGRDDAPIRLGWVGRFEHDKRPDRFLALLDRLSDQAVRFELILLGQRGRRSEVLDDIRARHGASIRFDGYAESRQQYEDQLRQIDVVVSTAGHEFFGIAVCEAIWAGAIPVTPDGLSYVEYVPESLRYTSIEQAAEIIKGLQTPADRQRLSERCRRGIADYRIDRVVSVIDTALEAVVAAG